MLDLTHQFFYLSISYLLALPRGFIKRFFFFFFFKGLTMSVGMS